jgi:hypothetical protein
MIRVAQTIIRAIAITTMAVLAYFGGPMGKRVGWRGLAWSGLGLFLAGPAAAEPCRVAVYSAPTAAGGTTLVWVERCPILGVVDAPGNGASGAPGGATGGGAAAGGSAGAGGTK